MDNLIGQSLGRYRLDKLLGQGGMGAVYQATDVTLQRVVAIKVMHAQYTRDVEFQKRFLNEARTAAQLKHPNVVQVLDFVATDAVIYIVMEFLPGQNLRKMLQELAKQDKWIRLSEAMLLMQQLCSTMEYVHQRGVVHRDLKPDNIMLLPQPTEGLPYHPVVTDLGLARLLTDRPTQDLTSLGTLAYMSPEQALGQEMDGRSDIYSLGIILYELAVGRLPFQISTITQAIRYHTREAVPPPVGLRPDLPEALDAAILRALEKNPAARFQTAGAMGTTLKQIPVEQLPTTTIVKGDGKTLAPVESLMTVYEPSKVRFSSDVVMQQFPPLEPDIRQDRICILSPNRTVRYALMKPQGLIIGRSSASDVTLDDDRVSKEHARVLFDGSDYFVTDLKSTNGTYMASMKLLPEVGVIWSADKLLRIGRHYLRLERKSSFGETSPKSSRGGATQQPTRTGQSRVSVFLAKTDYTVTPPSNVVVPLIVRNQSEVNDQFVVSVTGIPAEWLVGGLPTVNLLPNKEQEVRLTIQPPRNPTSNAGAYPIQLRVTSNDAPGEFAQTNAQLNVLAYHQLTTKLVPEKLRAGKTGQVNLQNQGNIAETVTLTWTDPGNDLVFTPGEARMTVAPGKSVAVPYSAVPRQPRWIGSEKVYAFTAQATPQAGEMQPQNGQLLSVGLIPPWLPPIALGAMLILCGLLYVLFVKKPEIVRFDLLTKKVVEGQPVTIVWEVRNADKVEIQPGPPNPKLSDTYTFPDGLPPGQTVHLVASNMFGPTDKDLAIVVLPAPVPTPTPTLDPGQPVIDWSLDPSTVVQGQSIIIRWNVTNADKVSIDAFGDVDLAGSRSDTPLDSKTYTIKASNRGNSREQKLNVIVVPPTQTPDAAATAAVISAVQQTQTTVAQQTGTVLASQTQQAAATQTAQAQQTMTAQASQTAQYFAQQTSAAGTAQAVGTVLTIAQTATASRVFDNGTKTAEAGPPIVIQTDKWSGNWTNIAPGATVYTLIQIHVGGGNIYIQFYYKCSTGECHEDVGQALYDSNATTFTTSVNVTDAVNTHVLTLQDNVLNVSTTTQLNDHTKTPEPPIVNFFQK